MFFNKRKKLHVIGEECSTNGNLRSDDSIYFELIPATGGRVLKVLREEGGRNVDYQRMQTLYVIPSGDDIGQRVSKIINLELLK